MLKALLFASRKWVRMVGYSEAAGRHARWLVRGWLRRRRGFEGELWSGASEQVGGVRWGLCVLVSFEDGNSSRQSSGDQGIQYGDALLKLTQQCSYNGRGAKQKKYSLLQLEAVVVELGGGG